MLAVIHGAANPFDLRTIVLARHAQHVVLVHFPIALFMTAVAFDVAAQWTKRQAFSDVAYFNLSVAALSIPLVLATGILAWRFQLEEQTLHGLLLLHLIIACMSTGVILLTWGLQFRARRRATSLPHYRFLLESAGVALIAATAHLGGFLSGVNHP